MERRTKQHDRETVLISSYHESFLVTICAPIISKSTVKTRKILITTEQQPDLEMFYFDIALAPHQP